MKFKKTLLLLSISTIMSTNLQVLAHTPNVDTTYQQEIMETGFRILNANKIDKRITFFYKQDNAIKTRALSRTKRILIYSGITPFIDDRNEIAAIISHQIARELDNHKGIMRRSARAIRPQLYTKKADNTAVDLMVNAGYNPIALISVMNKILSEPNWFDFFGGSKGSKRMISIYEYIYNNYPQYLSKNDYLTNIYYQNFLITSKKERYELKKKYEEKNMISVKYQTKKSKQQSMQK